MVVSRGAASFLIGLAVTASSTAWACYPDPPRPDLVSWWADGRGVTAVLAPRGTVISLGLDGHAWGSWTLGGRFGGLSADLSADGSTLVTLHPVWEADSGVCAVDALMVRATDLLTGVTTEVGTIGADTTYLDYTPDVSPSGRRVAVWAADLATSHQYQEIFNVEERTRERVIAARDVTWIDDDLFVAIGPDNVYDVFRASDGDRVGGLLDAAPPGRLEMLDTHAESSSVTVVEDRSTLITSTVTTRGVSVERQPLPAAIRYPPEGTGVVSFSEGYGRVAWLESQDSRLPAVVIYDTSTRQPLWRVEGAASYSTVSFSRDGAQLALVSHAPILFDGLGDMNEDGAPTLEIVDLATGHIVAWGRRWSRATRPEPPE